MKPSYPIILALMLLATMVTAGCGDDSDDGSDEYAGQPCETAEECYPTVDTDEILGDLVCLDDRVEGGYCTHTCDADTDCCAVVGECTTDLPQVCAPLESAPDSYCFVTCEDVDDEENYCELYVHPDFHCRSTGGGSENRKVCLPQ